MKCINKIVLSKSVQKALFMFFCIAFGISAHAQDPQKIDKIKADCVQRIPSLDIKIVDYKPWDFYWVKGIGSLIPNYKTQMRVDYNSDGKWVESRQIIYRNNDDLKELILSMLGNNKYDDFRVAEYVESAHSDPYYFVTLKSGEVYCTDKNFNKMPYGPMHIKGILTDQIKQEIETKLKNVYIYEGKSADEPDHYQFQAVFETEFVQYQQGKIVFHKSGQWAYTRYYMNNYDVIPLDLMMYVTDKGGFKNFGRVSYDKNKDSEYYSIEFKDGTLIKLDKDFNQIE